MISFDNNGNGTGTVTIRFTNELAKIGKAFDMAAKNIWGGNESKEIPNPDFPDGSQEPTILVYYSDLTNAEKLDIVGDAVREYIFNKAITQISIENHRIANINTENDDTIIV